ncbi:CROWDED NUCLEI 4 [Spatholobus suberectus]|nr:CROWDED NUCLEI 4 [Spatholobus suberectus]
MATPITPNSTTPASRSPLSEEEIWKRLKQAGFDENSIEQKDKATLVAYIAKLQAQIYDHLNHMGRHIIERKELASKYQQVKALIDSSEFMHKHDSAMHLSALIEARKREESLKKAVGVKEACIASLEKALHEMRNECAETKVSAESKFSEAHQLIDEAQKKSTEVEAKLRAAESFQAEACRYNSVADRKLRDVEAREDELRRQIISFKSDCDEKEKEIIRERQSISEKQNSLQQEQERLLQSQALLNQREDHHFSRSQELDSLQKELEDTRTNIDKEHGALCDEKTNLKLIETTLTRREETLTKWETELNKKEQELLDFQLKLVSRESDEIQKFTAVQEAALRARKTDFEAELQIQLNLVENEIEMKRRAWELKEVDFKQREDQLLEREHELEILSRALGEKEKDLVDMSSALKEKDQSLRASEKELALNKVLLQKEKEEIEKTKLDLQKSLVSLENNLRQVDHEKERLEAMKSETNDLSVLEVKLKEEIDLVRSQKLEIVAEAEKLKVEKSKFEAEWELLDEKKEELRKEAEYIAEEKKAVSTFIKKERDKLRQEKENTCNQYTRDLESLSCKQEEFMNKMAHEHDEWFGKIQQERADFLQDVEMQKRNMNILIEKRHEEIESYLKEREKSFEEEKNNELEYINALKEKAAKESEQVSFEMRRLEAERAEISLDREQRNKEWAELNKCIEELKVQRDKLQKQRELLHADRIEIHAQTEELKKLEDLKIVSDDISLTELLNSDMESNQRKISTKKNLKQWTFKHDDHLNSPKDANRIGNGFDTPFVRKSSVVSPPSPVRFSWIKRCTELIFRRSPEKLLMHDDDDKAVVSHISDVSNGQKHLTNDKSLDNVGERLQSRFSFGEPKVILEVPSPSDGCHVSKWKRGRGNFGIGDPLQDTRQNKKLRSEEKRIKNPLDQVTTYSAIPTQSDASKVQQLSILSNQTLRNTEGTRVAMVDKVIHISEVTSERIDAISVPNQESTDHLHNPTIGVDKCDLHGNKIDQSNSQIIEIDIPCGSSVFTKSEEICKGNSGHAKETVDKFRGIVR